MTLTPPPKKVCAQLVRTVRRSLGLKVTLRPRQIFHPYTDGPLPPEVTELVSRFGFAVQWEIPDYKTY